MNKGGKGEMRERAEGKSSGLCNQRCHCSKRAEEVMDAKDDNAQGGLCGLRHSN